MARRRKQNRKMVQKEPPFPATTALILLLLAGAAMGRLWLRDRCAMLGLRLQGLETQLEETRRQVAREEYKWSGLKSPSNIRHLLVRFNLDMSWPGEDRIVRLHRPELEPPGEEVRLAQRSGETRHD